MSQPKSMHATSYPVPPTTKPEPDPVPRFFRMFLHVFTAGAILNGYVSLQGLTTGKVVEPQYGGFAQYLTIIGLFTTITYMLVAALSDLLPAVEATHRIKRGFLLFVMPIELVVTIFYWTMTALSPQLMFPTEGEYFDEEPSSLPSADLLFRIPLWMDLTLHLLPSVALLGDFFVWEKRFNPPASTIGATLLAIVFALSYTSWIEHTATINKQFPYPFLTMMDFPGRVALYVALTLGGLGIFWGLNRLHA